MLVSQSGTDVARFQQVCAQIVKVPVTFFLLDCSIAMAAPSAPPTGPPGPPPKEASSDSAFLSESALNYANLISGAMNNSSRPTPKAKAKSSTGGTRRHKVEIFGMNKNVN